MCSHVYAQTYTSINWQHSDNFTVSCSTILSGQYPWTSIPIQYIDSNHEEQVFLQLQLYVHKRYQEQQYLIITYCWTDCCLHHSYHVFALIWSGSLWSLINSSSQLMAQSSQCSQKCISTTADNELLLGCQGVNCTGRTAPNFAPFLVTSTQAIQTSNTS